MPKNPKITPEQMAARNAIRRINRAIKCIVAAKDTERLTQVAFAINDVLVNQVPEQKIACYSCGRGMILTTAEEDFYEVCVRRSANHWFEAPNPKWWLCPDCWNKFRLSLINR